MILFFLFATLIGILLLGLNVIAICFINIDILLGGIFDYVLSLSLIKVFLSSVVSLFLS